MWHLLLFHGAGILLMRDFLRFSSPSALDVDVVEVDFFSAYKTKVRQSTTHRSLFKLCVAVFTIASVKMNAFPSQCTAHSFADNNERHVN